MVAKEKSSMTSDEFVSALDKLDLSIVGSSPYVGISKRQAQRIAAKHSPVPRPVGKLLRLVLRHKIDKDELLRM